MTPLLSSVGEEDIWHIVLPFIAVAHLKLHYCLGEQDEQLYQLFVNNVVRDIIELGLDGIVFGKRNLKIK